VARTADLKPRNTRHEGGQSTEIPPELEAGDRQLAYDRGSEELLYNWCGEGGRALHPHVAGTDGDVTPPEHRTLHRPSTCSIHKGISSESHALRLTGCCHPNGPAVLGDLWGSLP